VAGDDPILRERAAPVTEFTKALRQLVPDMLSSMTAWNGQGLAAPQIGQSLQVAVVDVGYILLVMVNPKIVARDGWEVQTEGCLSLPDVQRPIGRSFWVTVRAQGVWGEYYTVTVYGKAARAVQHEIDHLNGILITDHPDPQTIVQA